MSKDEQPDKYQAQINILYGAVTCLADIVEETATSNQCHALGLWRQRFEELMDAAESGDAQD